jgi:hypothetical protein
MHASRAAFERLRPAVASFQVSAALVRSVARILTRHSATSSSIFSEVKEIPEANPYPGLAGQWLSRARAQIHYLPTRSLLRLGRLRLPATGRQLRHINAGSLFAGCPLACSKGTPWIQTAESSGGTLLHHLTAKSLVTYPFATASHSDHADCERSAARAHTEWGTAQHNTKVLDPALCESERRQP